MGLQLQDDLLFVQDFVTVKQKVTFASVRFDDEAVANFFEDQVDFGRQPTAVRKNLDAHASGGLPTAQC